MLEGIVISFQYMQKNNLKEFVTSFIAEQQLVKWLVQAVAKWKVTFLSLFLGSAGGKSKGIALSWIKPSGERV